MWNKYADSLRTNIPETMRVETGQYNYILSFLLNEYTTGESWQILIYKLFNSSLKQIIAPGFALAIILQKVWGGIQYSKLSNFLG